MFCWCNRNYNIVSKPFHIFCRVAVFVWHGTCINKIVNWGDGDGNTDPENH